MSRDILRLERYAQRAALKARGLSNEDMDKNIIAVVYENDAAQLIGPTADGITAAGGIVVPFALPSGFAPAAEGDDYDLAMREAVADCTESVLRRSGCDGAVLAGGSAVVLTGMAIGAARFNLPCIVVTKGIGRGSSIWLDDAYARLKSGKISLEDFSRLESRPPMGTGRDLDDDNGCKIFLETAGLTLPGMALAENESAELRALCYDSGKKIVDLSKNAFNIRQSARPETLKNAAALICALGGPADSLIDILALAAESGAEIDFDTIAALAACPAFASISPRTDFDLYGLKSSGGLTAVCRHLASAGGKQKFYFGDGLPAAGDEIKADGEGCGVKVLKGNLAPDGALATGLKQSFTGKAVVFDSAEEADRAVLGGGVTDGSVIVVRYQGAEAKGMPALKTAVYAAAALQNIAVVTDGRLRPAGCIGVSAVMPEAAAAGPLAAVNTGDEIELDGRGKLTLKVNAKELNQRMKRLKPKDFPAAGVLNKFVNLVSSPRRGCSLKNKFR